jgi:hypothetical protein
MARKWRAATGCRFTSAVPPNYVYAKDVEMRRRGK